MRTRDGAAARFIEDFARNSREGKGAELIAQLGESFLFAGAQGCQWVRAGDFALALPKRKEIFEAAGHRWTELVDAEETWLGERYALVRTRWRFVFERAPESMETESSC